MNLSDPQAHDISAKISIQGLDLQEIFQTIFELILLLVELPQAVVSSDAGFRVVALPHFFGNCAMPSDPAFVLGRLAHHVQL